MLAAALGIALSRSALATSFERAKRESDVLFLPPPEQMLVASLGYRAAVADLLFAHVLVWYGQHLKGKLRFEHVAEYLEIATTLDPTFREPYYYSDTLITLQATPSARKDYEAARRLLEKGLKNRPYDTELWLVAGQFMAYVAPPYLEDPRLVAEWRSRGAKVLARACELVGNNENIPYHCITAAGLLDKAGDREAMIRFLERVASVVDDPEIQRLALAYLDRVRSERERDEFDRRRKVMEQKWKADLPAVNRTKALVIGPGFDPASCAGAVGRCPTSWRAFGEAMNPSDEAAR